MDEYDDEFYSRWKDAKLIRLQVLQQHFLRVSKKKTPPSACFQILTYKFLRELGCDMLFQNPNLCKTDVIDEVLHVLLCPFYPVSGHGSFCERFSV
jgi:hypothetical protein